MTFKGDLTLAQNCGSLENLSASYEYFAAVFQVKEQESYYGRHKKQEN